VPDPVRRPIDILFRAFFARFFASETATSDQQLRQTFIATLTFILVPGFVLLVQLFPAFNDIVIRAARFHTPWIVDDWLEWIVFVYVTYSMVTVGLIGSFVWDALVFDHRDAMVLGPLPLRGRMLVAGKLLALGALLAIAAVPVNFVNAFFFAFETSDRAGFSTLVTHFVAFYAATVLAAVFVFAALVVIRGAVSLVGGPRLAAFLGSVLQFLFIVCVLSCVFLSPSMWKIPSAVLNNNDVVGWLPTSWFLGLFEQLRGSNRAYFLALGGRALIATPVALVAAVIVSVAGFARQMQHAVARPATGDALAARVLRRAARWLAGRNQQARASADFVFMTIARNRGHHTPVAMATAIGVAVALAALTRSKTLEGLMQPRTIVLWIPLLIAYWMTIGVRAALFVPSELRAAWIFMAAEPVEARAVWSGMRAAALAIVAPAVLSTTTAVIVPLLGWRLAAWQGALALALTVAFIDATTLTVRQVPFARMYVPGRARLRTRWPLYLFGMFGFAMWPVRLELPLVGGGEWKLIAAAIMAAVVVRVVCAASVARLWSGASADAEADPDAWAVLDLGPILSDARSRA
jgi:hypothetical protein